MSQMSVRLDRQCRENGRILDIIAFDEQKNSQVYVQNAVAAHERI